MKLKTYVGCALTGAPQVFRDFVEMFKVTLTENFDVELLKFVGLTNGTPRDVFRTDLGNVRKCDAMIAFVDLPSIGLGMEIKTAIEHKKPLLCLHRSGTSVTRMLTGARDEKELEMVPYHHLVDALESAGQYLAYVRERSAGIDAIETWPATMEETG